MAREEHPFVGLPDGRSWGVRAGSVTHRTGKEEVLSYS